MAHFSKMNQKKKRTHRNTLGDSVMIKKFSHTFGDIIYRNVKFRQYGGTLYQNVISHLF